MLHIKKTYFFIFENFLFGVMLRLWQIDVICLDTEFRAMHWHRVQRLSAKYGTARG